MGWRDLLQTGDESIVAPWFRGRSLRLDSRAWTIEGKLPPEVGWHSFGVTGRKVRWTACADPVPEILGPVMVGYLVGDRLLPDAVRVDPDPVKLAAVAERVLLIEPGLERFVRVSAGRSHDEGPLVYRSLEMPLGPEESVLGAYLDEHPDLSGIASVPPALDAAFRLESWRRVETARRRAELERKRREEEERRAREARRQEIVERLGDAAGRRAMALVDFAEAARAALAVGGAQYLDHRNSPRKHEVIVTFRLDGTRFQCTCDSRTLAIIDAGICLTDHATGEKGDTYFTLESFPAVIRQAEREDKLVVWRHPT